MYLSLINKRTAGNGEVLALTGFKILKWGEQGEKGLNRLLNEVCILRKYHRFQKQPVWTRENGLQINQEILDFKIYVTGKWELRSNYHTDMFQNLKNIHFLQLSQCQNKYLYVWTDVKYCRGIYILATLNRKFSKIGGIICCPNCNIHINLGWREKCWFNISLFPHTEPDFWVQINWKKKNR